MSNIFAWICVWKWGSEERMSGAWVCVLLGELGHWGIPYSGAEGLDLDSVKWPFQYDDARPILDWICSSLRPSNVLSLSPDHHKFPGMGFWGVMMVVFWEVGGGYGGFAAENWRRRWWLWYGKERCLEERESCWVSALLFFVNSFFLTA